MRISLFLLPVALLAQTPPAGAPSPAAKPASQVKPVPRKSALKPAPPAETPLTTEDEKTIYALGLSVYQSLSAFNLTPAELDIIKRALTDAEAKKPAVQIEVYGPKIQGLAQARAQQRKTAGQAFAEKFAAEPGAVKMPSGLIYKEIRPGTGASPMASDTVKVNYRGTFVDGVEFDSSYKRGEPATFGLNQVIPCWTEGVQKLKVGGKAELVCPSEIAYGENGRPGIPGGSTLVFEIELVDIPSAAGTPPAPAK